MAEWRIARGWTEHELQRHLAGLASLPLNFDEDPETLPAPGWSTYSSEAVIAQSRPGPPRAGGAFDRGREAISSYEFSDTRIVRAHFDNGRALPGRPMLLEIKAFRVLHYLSGVVVGEVRSEAKDDETAFGFRYDTLEGHIERGSEWFMLRKKHDSGEIRFRICASWLPGDFPNWWSRIGFAFVGRYYQRKWHLRAHEIMSGLVKPRLDATSHSRDQQRTRPDVLFERTASRV